MQIVSGIWFQNAQASQTATLDSGNKEALSGLCQKTCYLGRKRLYKVLFSRGSSVNQFSVRGYCIQGPAEACYEEKYSTPTANHASSEMN